MAGLQGADGPLARASALQPPDHDPCEAAARGEPIQIDVEIVPLIKAIWSHDFETLLSCQDQDGRVWVELPGRDAQRLLRLLAGQDGELRGHILRMLPIEVDPDEFDAYHAAHSWEYSVMALSEAGELFLAVSIRFPRDQLPAVVSALGAVAA